MFVSDHRWAAPLHALPVINQVGIGTHGIHRTVENYSHLGIWCLHVYRYHAELGINGQWYNLAPGYASFVPPDTDLEYRYRGKSVHAYVHFSLASPRDREAMESIASVQDLGAAFSSINQRLEEVIAFHATQPTRAAVRLWDILWQLAEARATTARETQTPPAITQLLREIELRLGQRLHVADLAAQVGLSHNHLIRQFRKWVGMAPVQYLRRRRVERASHLLTHTTLPVKSIAAEVGIPDLHLFNKVMREAIGASPRQIRGGASTT